MRLYTTCRDCSGNLLVTDGDTVHPMCQPKPTLAEKLADDWLAAVEDGDERREAVLQAKIGDLGARPPRYLDAALRYASWGWPVFPLLAGSKRPATPNGFKDATTDLDRIRAWWGKHPDHGIGLPTGVKFDVIDFDTPVNVVELQGYLSSRTKAHGHVATSSGGIHFYVKPTGRGNSARFASKDRVDYRGEGGYVVAPPTTLGPKGRAWSWVSAPSPVITGYGEVWNA